MNIDLIKLAKESKKMITTFIIAGTIVLIPSFLGCFDFLLLKNGAFAIFILTLLLAIVFSIVWCIRNLKKTETSPDPKEVQKRFESEEMTQCKIKLTDWLRENSPDEYEKQISLPIEKRDKSFKGIDEARRFIAKCFWNIWECHRDGLLSDKDIKDFVYSDGIDLIINKIEPLEIRISKVTGNDYGKAAFNFFRKLLINKSTC